VTDTADTADAPDVIRPPRTVFLAFAATIASVVFSIISAAAMWGLTSYVRHELVRTNNKLKASDKNKKHPYDLTSHDGLAKVNHDMHGFLLSGLVQLVVFGVALVLVAWSFRGGRSWARWLTVVLLAIPVVPTATPYRLLSLGGNAPLTLRAGWALAGLTGVAAIVLLLTRETSQYFTTVRGVRPGARAGGAAPMGLRGLFGPRPQPADADAAGTRTSSTQGGSRAGSARAGSSKSGETRSGATRSGAGNTRSANAIEPPADKAGAVRTAKAKARAGTEPAPSQSRPSTSVASKNRGKSRKGS